MGGMLAGMGGLGRRRVDQSYNNPGNTIAPGQAGVFRGRQVIVSSSGSGTGVFVYSGAGAPGNPPVAWAVAPGVTADPFGNPLPASGGFETVGTLGLSALKGGALVFAQTSSPPAGSQGGSVFQPGGVNGSVETFSGLASASDTGAAITAISKALSTHGAAQAVVTAGPYLSGQTSALWEVQGASAADSFVTIVSGAAEIWHNVGAVGQPAFAAGFGSSGGGLPPVRFQLEGINGGRVVLSGQVALTANQLGNAAIFTLPAGYLPAFQQAYVTNNNLSGYALGGNSIHVDTAGVVRLGAAGTAGNVVNLDGIRVTID